MPGKLRWQIFPLILVIITILSPNLIYITDNNPIYPYDPTPIAFSIAGLIIFFKVRVFRFLDIAPVAHYQVFKNVTSGVIVLDHQSRIVEMNPAAEDLLHIRQDKLFGEPVSELLPEHLNLPKLLQKTEAPKVEIELDEKRFIELQITPFESQIEGIDNHILMLYDISERKVAEQELRKQATTDSLTGVYNRRHFYDLAEPIFNQTVRYERNLAALMIDLDHFKKINDQYLHHIGDQVLIAIANLIQNQIRSPDIMGRYGGEEFVILMPETDINESRQAAERIRHSVASKPIETDIGPVPITISVGLATFDHKQDVNIDVLVNRADQALYAAKQSGRNRVVTASNHQKQQVLNNNKDIPD